MPYEPTTIRNFDRRGTVIQFLHDNVLLPMVETHELLASSWRGLPHSEKEALTDVVHNSQIPAGFVDRQPLADLATSSQASQVGDGSFAATVSQRITDTVVWIMVLDHLKRDDVVIDKHEEWALPIFDLVYATPRMAGSAMTVEIVNEGNTHRTMGSRIAYNFQLIVPVAWNVR